MRDDWLMVKGEVHYCNSRAWFKHYRPLVGIQIDGHIVRGIGLVHLPFVYCTTASDSATTTLVLENVLYIETMEWNGLNYESVCAKSGTSDEDKHIHRAFDSEGRSMFYGICVGGGLK